MGTRFTTEEELAEGWLDSDYMVEGKWRVQFSRRLSEEENLNIDHDALWDPQVGSFSMLHVISEVKRVAPDITVLRSKTYDQLPVPAQEYSEWDTERWTVRVIPRVTDEQYSEANKAMDAECWDEEEGFWKLDKFRGVLEEMFPNLDAMQYRTKT